MPGEAQEDVVQAGFAQHDAGHQNVVLVQGAQHVRRHPRAFLDRQFDGRPVEHRWLGGHRAEQSLGLVDGARIGQADRDHRRSQVGLELGRGALGDDPAVVDHHHPIGQAVSLLEVLRGEQHVRATGDQRADDVPELEAAPRVEAARRFVEQQEPRTPDQAGAEVETAAHATGIRAHLPVRGVGEVHLLEHRAGVTPGIGGRRTEEAGNHDHVLASGHRGLDRGRLPGECDVAPHSGGLACDVEAVDLQRARIGPDQCGDEVDEGRLARAVRTEQRHDLAGLHR